MALERPKGHREGRDEVAVQPLFGLESTKNPPS